MIRTLTLTLTENCNLSCVYCYEQHHQGCVMSFETACNILDDEFSALCNEDIINIEFFGGEPFLEFELIKRIVEYIKDKSDRGIYSTPYTLFATSNGTLVHDEVMEWLKSNPDFIVGLSLDGTKEMQDYNRSNSYDKIDLDFFVNQYKLQPIKMTISNQTLGEMAKGVIFAHSKGFRVFCNLACGIDWNDVKLQRTLYEQLKILIDYYLANPEIERASILARDISRIGYQSTKKDTVNKYCGTGTAMHTYDVFGNIYPCQFFMPLSCGEEKSKNVKEIVFESEVPIKKLDKKCRECLLRDLCPTCYGSNYYETGNIYKKDDSYCVLEKITFYANACLILKLWDCGQLTDFSEEKLLASLYAARDIITKFEKELSYLFL